MYLHSVDFLIRLTAHTVWMTLQPWADRCVLWSRRCTAWLEVESWVCRTPHCPGWWRREKDTRGQSSCSPAPGQPSRERSARYERRPRPDQNSSPSSCASPYEASHPCAHSVWTGVGESCSLCVRVCICSMCCPLVHRCPDTLLWPSSTLII